MGTEVNLASGNPSFMCKGKTPSKKLVKLMHDSNYCGGASGVQANFGGIFFRQIEKGQPSRLGQSTCFMVKKECPFFSHIKGNRKDDMASGNPSFMCKGKTNLTKD
jgi:hypothetical protein